MREEKVFDSPEQVEAIAGLHNAMGGLMFAVIKCDKSGIPLADAFTAIGMEIPLFLKPMVNQLADKLPNLHEEDIVPIAT